MRRTIAIATTAVALAAAGGARAASVEIRDAVARVTVVPEDRADIKVEFLTRNAKLPMEVRTVGSDVVIDGGLAHRIRSCSRSERPHAWVWGVGEVAGEAIPQVVIRTPRAVTLASNGAVFGAIGRAGSVRLHDSGCSAWTIADVQGDVSVEESGAGVVRMGAVGRLDVRLSGAADIHAVRVRHGMAASLSGKGRLQVEDLMDGPMDAHVSGLGRVRVAEGRATNVRALVSGMGGVDFGGSAGSLEADISGVGAVHVRQVTGQVTKSISGIGHVSIDDQRS